MTKYPNLKEMVILYVEDNLEARKLYAKNIERKVKTLYSAVDGEDGFNKYLEFKPDIIITDIEMPIINGLEMTRKIRELDEDIPIIITSAYNTVDLLTESLDLDISGYLVKPINGKRLFKMLDQKAELIIARKEDEMRNRMLQSIINADSHLLAVTDLETVIFSNNTFLNLFNVKDLEEFNEKHTSIMDIFMPHNDYLSKDLLKENETFVDLVFRTPETERNVMVFDYHTFNPRSFQITLTPITRKDGLDIYLLTLIDISMLTLEKLEMRKKVYYDNLTNIYNRNKIDEVFNKELLSAKEKNTIFSIILIDIDHFKNFNDTFGHLIGDEVLIVLAKTIQDISREEDIFARWGGEEFLVILPNTTKENAGLVAEILRKSVEKIVHKTAGGITASFGVTEYIDGSTEKSMYEKCDEALYTAKENGRNRVEIN